MHPTLLATKVRSIATADLAGRHVYRVWEPLGSPLGRGEMNIAIAALTFLRGLGSVAGFAQVVVARLWAGIVAASNIQLIAA